MCYLCMHEACEIILTMYNSWTSHNNYSGIILTTFQPDNVGLPQFWITKTKKKTW